MHRKGFKRGLLLSAMIFWMSTPVKAGKIQTSSEPLYNASEQTSEKTDIRPFGIAAYVNGEAISCDEVEKITKELKLPPPEALNFLVEQKLLYSDFKKKGGKISGMHVEAQLETMAKEHFKGDRELMRRVLKQQGQSLYGLRKEIREAMMLNAMRQGQIPSRFAISPKDIAAYYEAHASDFREEARYCLKQSGFKATETIDVPKVVREGEREQTETVTKEAYLQRLLAQKTPLSDIQTQLDTFRTEELWYAESELDSKLVQILRELPNGSQTPYLRVGDTFVSSMLIQKIEGHLKPLKDVQEVIEEHLLTEIAKERHRQYLRELRERASVRIF